MTIKEAAGKVLLLLYYKQTTNPAELESTHITFSSVNKTKLDTSTKLKSSLHEICVDDATLYNAVNYLLERGLIDAKQRKDVTGVLFLLSPRVTYLGVDTIEGVEQGEEGQKVVKTLFNFNIKVRSNINVDSLIKTEIGNIVGIGGAISGKVTTG